MPFLASRGGFSLERRRETREALGCPEKIFPSFFGAAVETINVTSREMLKSTILSMTINQMEDCRLFLAKHPCSLHITFPKLFTIRMQVLNLINPQRGRGLTKRFLWTLKPEDERANIQ